MKSPLLEQAEHLTGVLLQFESEGDESRAARLHALREQEGLPSHEHVATDHIIDTRVEAVEEFVDANDLQSLLPLSQQSVDTTAQARQNIESIFNDEDDRLVVIVGPCSIHNPESALQYADKVAEWRKKYGNNLEIIMRAYVEKPRTTKGWKGLINDPYLNGSTNISVGVTLTRLLFQDITERGVPIATERIEPLISEHLNGLSSYDAIGARDSESTRARNQMSVTSSVTGAKNGTEGNLNAGINAIEAANTGHAFIGISRKTGRLAKITSTGNPTAHLLLRGGGGRTNYDAESVALAKNILAGRGLMQNLGIDASHDNSFNPATGAKDPLRQIEVANDIAHQISVGETVIKLIMIESNLKAGKQAFDVGITNPEELDPELSVTDPGIGIEDTEKILQKLHDAIQIRRAISTQSATMEV